MGIDLEKLELKVKARKAAEAVIELLKESVDGDPKHFWIIIRDTVLKEAPLKPHATQIIPMTDVEADRFEMETMPYGEFKLQPVGLVPMKRLDWYAGQTDEFRDNLRRYLANEKVKARVREELE